MQSAFPCTIAVCRGLIFPLFLYSTSTVGLALCCSSKNFITSALPYLAAKCSIVTGGLNHSNGYNPFTSALSLGTLSHVPARHCSNVLKSSSNIALCNASLSFMLSSLLSCICPTLNGISSILHSHSMIAYLCGSLSWIETPASIDGVCPALLHLSSGNHNILSDIDSIITLIARTLPHLAATCSARSPSSFFNASCIRVRESLPLSIKPQHRFSLSASAFKSSYMVSSI